MSLQLRVTEPAGVRRFSEDRLPVRFGSAATADVRVPGPVGNDAFAQIDQLDGVWFVQVLASDAGLMLNDAPLTGSRRLRDGDRLEIFGTQLRCSLRDGGLDITIDWASSTYRTAPPVEPVGGAEAVSGEIIAAQYQRRREQAPPALGRRVFGWRLGVGIAAGMLIGLAALLFTSISVRLETVPESPERIAIRGGWFQLPLGERYLLRPGSYRVHIESAGYFDLVHDFEVTKQGPNTLRLQLEPRPGTLHLSATPVSEATVSLDGEPLGRTPLTVEGVERGRYVLRFEAERYLPWQGVIDVEGLGTEQAVSAQLVPAFGRVRVTSEPAGAGIYSGRNELARTPAVVEIPEGRQSIILMLDGYKPADLDVAVMADTLLELDSVALAKADGILTVRTRPSGANVTVDGRYRGQSPVKLALAPGQDYLIGLSKSGYGQTSRNVRMNAAEGQVLDVDLTARLGEIEFSITPADAKLIVNGQEQPDGKRELQLPASPQRVEVRRAGYESWSETVTPRPGYPQRVTVRLRTLDQARIAEIKQLLTTSQGQVLRYIDPGTFQMGASRREPGRRANETLRNVSLTRAYYIGTREITNREFALFKANHDSGSDVAAALAGDRNPVVNVSWQDAAAFCNWLSKQDGLTPVYEEKFGKLVPIRPTPEGYRLPTEAEWVWAARYQGGAGYLKFPWGEEMPPAAESGNYADLSAKGLVPTYLPNYDDGFAATAPVASFKGNLLGLHDFGGNAAEWVSDYYQVYTPDSTRIWTDPEGPEQARHHVIRGSSWRHATVTELRFSFRDFGDDPRIDVGFRIARNAP